MDRREVEKEGKKEKGKEGRQERREGVKHARI